MSTILAPPSAASFGPPSFEGPAGPVWHVDGPIFGQGAGHFVVRRFELGEGDGLLRLGPLLAHASRADHPRLAAPVRWVREGHALWIAMAAPPGRPLALEPVGRLTWFEAVELWSPLAEAVAAAHTLGVCHGHIDPWSVWRDAASGRLTLLGAGLWAVEPGRDEPLWAPEMQSRPGAQRRPTPATDVLGLARLLLVLALPAEAARTSPNLSGIPAFAIPAIARALDEDPRRRLQTVGELMRGVRFHAQATGPAAADDDPRADDQRADDTRLADNARLSDNSGQTAPRARQDVMLGRTFGREEIVHPRQGRGVRFFVSTGAPEAAASLHEETNAPPQLGAFFYQSKDPALYDSIRWAWDGAEINLFDAGVVTDSTGRRYLTGSPDCLPVLEPHWPVSVSDVLGAGPCTSRMLVDLRDGGESGRALVFGLLVHGFLEDLTAERPHDTSSVTFEEVFEERLPAMRVDLLAAGLSDADLPKFAIDARAHFANLVKFTAARDAHGARLPDAASAARGVERVGWSGRHVEATRYSTRFGLEGRIDLVTDDPREGLQIIELKTGRPWDDHNSQVRCYTLLWSGLADAHDRPLSGYLLYSGQGRLAPAPLDDLERERRILRARNELVAMHRSHLDPTVEYRAPHFMENPRNCNAGDCRFRRDRCREQTLLLGLDPKMDARAACAGSANGAGAGPFAGFTPELVARVWAYHRHMTRLVEMEHWEETASLGRILAPHRLEERLRDRSALAGLTLVEVDAAANRLTLTGEGVRLFAPGDVVLVHRGDFETTHFARATCVSTSTHPGRAGRIVLRTACAAAFTAEPSEGWILDALPARIGYRNAHRALYGFVRSRRLDRATVLLATDSPDARALMSMPDGAPGDASAPESALLPTTKRALNPAQLRAVALGLHAPAGALIQGPPGTGKTTVIAHLVRELVARGKRVLVCALTNTAVDTMLGRIFEAGPQDQAPADQAAPAQAALEFLRVGASARSRELAWTIERGGNDPARFFTDDLARRTESLDALAERFDAAPVVGCTAHAAVSSAFMGFLKRRRGPVPFDVVIVDEAGQLTEPAALGPLNLAQRFVLVGDHRQLPPIVQNELAQSVFIAPADASRDDASRPDDSRDDDDATARMGLAGLDRSLFERLVERLPHVMLEEQHRMHADIMAFSNTMFYDGRLVAHPRVAGHTLDAAPAHAATGDATGAVLVGGADPVVFVHVEATDSGRTNPDEARATVATLVRLRAAHPRASIGVISPFRAQVYLLRELLAEALGDEAASIDVDTVERFQGSERDIILVSLVKTARTGEFLADERRLNVTLTRARKKLVVFGHRPCLELSPLYRQLLEQPQTKIVEWNRSYP